MPIRLILFILLVSFVFRNAVAQDNAALLKQLEQRAADYKQHFDAHDARQLALLYATDCDVVHDGQPRSSRQEIQTEYEKHFAENPHVTTQLKDVRHRILSPRIAVESGTWLDSGHSVHGLSTGGMYVSVYEKRDGQWQIVHERAWPSKDQPVTTMSPDELPELGDYLRGSWKITGSNRGQVTSGKMTVSPTADGRAQFYEWTAETAGQVTHGSAIGGIDPATGGVVEHGFSSDGDAWVNRYEGAPLAGLGKATGVRIGTSSGQAASGKISVDRTSQDRFTYQVAFDGESVDLVFERVKLPADGWSFLQGTWELTGADGNVSTFRLVPTPAGDCFVASAESAFEGVFGTDHSQDHPLLSLGIHIGEGYAVGHFKHMQDGKVSGGFTMNSGATVTEHTGVFEPIAEGYKYTVDGNQVNYFRRK